jgi:sulfonate transport system substrate-binding protein
MKHLRIGGVPEHFNLAFKRLAARPPVSHSRRFVWTDYPGGSGAMSEALDADELDVAVMLTEGAVAGIARGGRYRIVSTYVDTALNWGVHVPGSSDFRSVDALAGTRFAISRYGSGSHLMSYALARKYGWELSSTQFVEVGSLEGAIDAFAGGRAEVFLWEKIMTRPVVDSGAFRRIGEFAAAWPAFVVCATEKVLRQRADEVRRILDEVLEEARTIRQLDDAERIFARMYGIGVRDVREWLGETRWAETVAVEPERLEGVATFLREMRLIPAQDLPELTATG